MNTAQLSNMHLTRGDTFIQNLLFKIDGEPLNLNLFTSIRVDVRKGITRQGILIKALTLADGISISGDADNILTLKLEPAITDTMREGRYYLDIQVKDVDDNKFTYAWGIIQVRENITN